MFPNSVQVTIWLSEEVLIVDGIMTYCCGVFLWRLRRENDVYIAGKKTRDYGLWHTKYLTSQIIPSYFVYVLFVD